jgi:phenylpropionate dioxygenase-like ring-hydroxylating dioxygenase large terminal subunit
MSLKDYWYIAAESSDVNGRPKSVEVYGERLVLFRGPDGRATALEDRCAHRNMELSRGRLADGCIECPYHGWRFNTAGRCVHVPSLGPAAARVNHTVRGFPIAESDGFVWVFLGNRGSTPGLFRFPHFEDTGWTSFHMKTRFAGSVEACLENFLDCPHTVYVHQGWFRSHEQRPLKAIVRASADSVEVEFQGEPITDSVVSRLFFPRGRELRHTDRFSIPNISRVDYDFGPDRHFIITSQCTPISEHDTEVYTVITYRFGRIGRLVRFILEPICRKIIRQDVDILGIQSEQLRRFGGPRFTHVETDLLGLKIKALRQRAERGQPAPTEPQRAREICICF